MAQVYDPYQRTLASKYPFDRASRVEASPAEIAKVFGAEGSVAKFTEQALGALVVRRGDVVTAKTWADMGVRLRPEFAAGLGMWVAPLAGQGAAAGGAGGGGASASAEAQTVFQMLPLAAPGLTEYTVDIDGQAVRYRNGAASWSQFVWPGPGTPGVRISGVMHDGRSVEFFNQVGRFGLEKMINSAQRKKLDGNTFELRWPQDGVAVAVQLRIVSNTATSPAAAPPTAAGGAGKEGASVSVSKPGALPAIIVGPADEATASAGAAQTGVNP
jgi:type VI secretion system protein ImpL